MARSGFDLKDDGQQNGRRNFLKLGFLTAAASVVPQAAWAYAKRDFSVRTLSFYNEHTQETLSAKYYKDGAYLQKALGKINYILRDHRSGDVHPIDKSLLDLLYVLSKDLNTPEPFHIISGYRSPHTNAKLRKNTKGVAKKSLHMVGQAIDIALPNLSLRKVRRAAINLSAGGVGYYPESSFVHVDIGPVRTW